VKLDNPLYNGQTIISADKGTWVAVVEEGGCSSIPSGPAVVSEDLTGAPIPAPQIKINGSTTPADWSFCQGGSAFLEVANYDPQYMYIWYANNSQFATGTGIYYTIPTAPNIVLRLQVTGNGCAQEANVNQTISATQAPEAPVILGDGVLCGGNTALSAGTMVTAPTTFTWYKDGAVLAGQTTQSINVSATGIYHVTVTDGACTSTRSEGKTVVLSDFASLNWIQNPASAYYGSNTVYEVSATNPPVTFQWTIMQGISNITSSALTAGQGTYKIGVRFPASGDDVSVTVTATNACGSDSKSQEVSLSDVCPAPTIASTSPTMPTASVNVPFNLTVIAANTISPTYQWYQGSLGDTGTPVGNGSSSYSYTPTATGVLTYWCRVTNHCSGGTTTTVDSPLFIVNIVEIDVSSFVITGNNSIDANATTTLSIIDWDPADATYKTVIWSYVSGPGSIPSQTGTTCLVQASSSTGTILVRATSFDGKYTTTYQVHVQGYPNPTCATCVPWCQSNYPQYAHAWDLPNYKPPYCNCTNATSVGIVSMMAESTWNGSAWSLMRHQEMSMTTSAGWVMCK
jgi:hypothetical protein